MRAYSGDLRRRIVEAVTVKKFSKPAVAELYGISRASVYRYLELDMRGDLAPKKRPGQSRRLDAELCQKLLGQLEAHEDATLAEHAELFEQAHGVTLKKSSIGNYFARLGVRRKKDLSRSRAG